MITACGVDPGMHGAIAVIRPDGTAIAFEMPGTPKELARLFIDRLLPMKIDHAIIEGLHARPGNGSISTFKLARNCGLLIGMMELSGISYEEMPPRSWQKALGVVARHKPPKVHGALINYEPEESYGQFKKRLMGIAVKLFPRMEVNLTVCDALLIAETCRRMNSGYLGRSIV